MLACKEYSTTGNCGGYSSSYNPAANMSAPLNSSETPMKNQIEMDPPVFITTYHKRMFKITSTTATTAAQKIGRL